MIDAVVITDILAGNYLAVGVVIGQVILTTLAALTALAGLSYGVRGLYLTLGNYPGGWGYNPRYGSGRSRFQQGRRNSSGGLNLMA